MSRDMEIERRARLRRALVKAGREERASDTLRATLLAVAATTAAAPVAIAAASSSGTASVSNVAAAANVAASVAPAASTTAAVASAKGALAWKVLAVLLAIGGVGTGAAFFASRDRAPVASPAPMVTATATAPASSSVAPQAAVPNTRTPQEIAAVSVDDLPTVKAAPSTRSAPLPTPSASSQPTPAAAAPTASPAARLTDETRAVGAIRSALHKGDTREALRLVDAYEAEFPRGVLAEEAEVLRIETLLRAGAKDEATKRASRFLAERPASPHAARVRTMTRRLSEPE